MFLFLFSGAALLSSWGSWGGGGRAQPKRRIHISLPFSKRFLIYFPQVQSLTVCFAFPRAGCPRERQWEAVELASAAGEAGLPVCLC